METESIPKLTKKEYKVIEGAGSVYTLEKDKSLTVRSDGEYKKFVNVEIDGKVVDSKYYTAWSGSTYIKFKKEFMNTLAAGDHTVRFNYKDGYATAVLTVVQKDGTKTEAAPSADTNKAKDQTANATVTAPKTGDTFQPALWAAVLGISVVGLFGMAVVSRKRKQH